MDKLTSRFALILVCVVAAGCESSLDQLVKSGYPPAYADGYAAGCSSGRHAAGAAGGFQKDAQRFSSDTLYAQGWSDGLNQCQAQATSRQGQEDRWDLIWRERNDRREQRIDQERGQSYR